MLGGTEVPNVSGSSSVPPARAAVGPTVTSTTTRAASECRTCAGRGWKYTTHRTALRMVAQSCRDARVPTRRSCMDCGGRGTSVATVS
jgi:DnaJ-class molecular chaperone